MEVLGAVGAGHRAALTTGGSLRVRVSRVSAVAAATVVMLRKRCAAAVHSIHGLQGQRAQVKGQVLFLCFCFF